MNESYSKSGIEGWQGLESDLQTGQDEQTGRSEQLFRPRSGVLRRVNHRFQEADMPARPGVDIRMRGFQLRAEVSQLTEWIDPPDAAGERVVVHRQPSNLDVCTRN